MGEHGKSHEKVTEEIKRTKFEGDYKVQLLEMVEEMRRPLTEIPIEQRKEIVEMLTDAYVEQTGERPDSAALYALGDILLYDYMEGDRRQNKTQLEEYPILTDNQYEARTKGKRPGNQRGIIEVSIEAAANIGTDGVNHSLPIRRYD